MPIPETVNLSSIFFTGLLSATIWLAEPKLVVGRSDSTYVSSDGVKVRTVDAGVLVAVEIRVGVAVTVIAAVGVLVGVAVVGELVLVDGGVALDKVCITSWGTFAAASRLLKLIAEVLVVLTPRS